MSLTALEIGGIFAADRVNIPTRSCRERTKGYSPRITFGHSSARVRFIGVIQCRINSSKTPHFPAQANHQLNIQPSIRSTEDSSKTTEVNMRHSGNDSNPAISPLVSVTVGEREVVDEGTFRRMISIERKRTERSQKPFLLMLLETSNYLDSNKNGKALNKILSALQTSIRETDVAGWYKNHRTIGTLFTGLSINDKNSILGTMLTKVCTTLQDNLTFEQFNQISLSFHLFPDDWEDDTSGRPSNPTLYPDLSTRNSTRWLLNLTKRMMDIVGSAFALIVCSPLFMMIALVIKSSSKGPVFFKQQRVGQHGKRFTFLKFRSMRVDNDPSVHREYVTTFIAGQAERHPLNGNGPIAYKLTNDQRITRVGALLRRQSLDELPQFLNVLKGDMSLVGPRPAIPYEVAVYQTWHRHRLLEVKPGITGMWQIDGRNRVKFDDMVRLDLRYAKSWSPWLDVKILTRTPRAVLKGEGAY
jgi:lipopolysaccharide/colanic/teichoic acid biosynthesis glycosyltransferase